MLWHRTPRSSSPAPNRTSPLLKTSHDCCGIPADHHVHIKESRCPLDASLTDTDQHKCVGPTGFDPEHHQLFTAVAAVCCAMFIRALVVAPAAVGLPWAMLLGVGGGVAVIVEQLQRMVGSSAANAMTRAQQGTRAALQREAASVASGQRAQSLLASKKSTAAAGPAAAPPHTVMELSAAASSSITLAQPVLRIREDDVDPVMAVDLQFDYPKSPNPLNPALVQRFGGYRRQATPSLPPEGRIEDITEDASERHDKGVVCTEAELEEAVQHAVEAALHDSNVKLKLQVCVVY